MNAPLPEGESKRRTSYVWMVSRADGVVRKKTMGDLRKIPSRDDPGHAQDVI